MQLQHCGFPLRGRNIGKAQELFMLRAWPCETSAQQKPDSSPASRFHPVMSPGSCFWFPPGVRIGCFASAVAVKSHRAPVRIYNKLMDFMRSEYRLRGFSAGASIERLQASSAGTRCSVGSASEPQCLEPRRNLRSFYHGRSCFFSALCLDLHAV